MANRIDSLVGVDADDVEWCHDTVESVSRTFAISIDLLDEPMSTTLCVGYLVCRIADTIEDEDALSPEEKIRLLSKYRRILDPVEQEDTESFVQLVETTADAQASDDWSLVANSGRVLQAFESLPPEVKDAITPPTLELIDGMEMFVQRYADQEGIRIQTEEELEEYCHYVAGVIGCLITNLQLWHSNVTIPPDQMRDLSESCGQLLQLVNIAKDVHTDYTDEGNIYLPATWLAEVGVSQEDVLTETYQDNVVTVVERTVEHAQSYLDDGQAWLEELPKENEAMLAACTVPFLLAVATLRELSDRPEDALSKGGVKISRKEVMTIVASVTNDFDKSSLEQLRESIRRGDLK